ncbi:hypothetical protein BDZ97DRAFT_1671975 [Flammula alnicola]|nr:hypothetical protein BDZ97DRAFT_1671975 [Flammula alnicola]
MASSISDSHVELVERVPELWFDDATVVFQAENKLFRVHRGIIASQSSVFKGMFALPQDASVDGSGGGQETIDGCTLIRLHGDTATDVGYFFKAIYDASFFEPPPCTSQFDVVIAIALLSHKYDVPFLHRRSLDHLETVYPTTLSNYDSISTRSSFRPQNLNINDNIRAIQTLIQIGAKWMMPAACYTLSVRSIQDVISCPAWKTLAGTELQTRLLLHWSQITSTLTTVSIYTSLLSVKVICPQERCQTFAVQMVRHLMEYPERDPLVRASPQGGFSRPYCERCAAYIRGT